jgi:transcriptional regulator with XRE-family HTH domain
MREVGITPAQCRAGREALQWSQQELAARAKLSRPVVQDFERRVRIPMRHNLAAIREALEAGGVVLLPGGAGRSGVSFVDADAG